MSQQTLARNPFMLLLNPETVLAAMERSEMLGALSRRTCSPLDRPVPTAVRAGAARTPSVCVDDEADTQADGNDLN